MSWDAAVFGTLTMPAASTKAWLASEVDSAKVPNAETYLSMAEVSGQTVKKTLAQLERFKDKGGLGFIELERSPNEGSLCVRSFFSKDDYLERSVALAAVWTAAGTNASGELFFAGMLTASFCYKLTIGPKGVTLAEASHRVIKKLPAYEGILTQVEAKVAELGL